MRFESKLCHLSDTKAVVQVNGWLKDKNLGSALAEGPTVDIAEDNAINRLNKRIKALTINQPNKTSDNKDKEISISNFEEPQSKMNDIININQEPSDWSNELTAIDSEIQRLKWSREDENEFLEKTLGYNNRNKITNYSDIVKYLNLLKNNDKQYPSNDTTANINNLIEESDNIIRDLSWSNKQGREYLQKEFNVSTRKELNEAQLISFVEKLKSIKKNNI
ncbi:hypothetical protein [Prochlorococcus sp. MIT 0916]|uniref:hypothetical protein n=1 Tax=Prochlorococcus sp. MIT 0916 TaxID=3082521 RepID=UPI0039B56A71